MFEIGLMLFGAKRWILSVFKGLFGNRYFWLAIGLIAALWLAWHWHTSTVARAVQSATQTENSRLTAQFEQAKAQAVRDEQTRANSIIQASREHYEQQRQNLQNRADRLLADTRSGLVRLRVPIKPAACAVSSGNASGIEPNPGAIITDVRAELSDDAHQFFIGQARRADAQALQLNELIDIVERLRLGMSSEAGVAR